MPVAISCDQVISFGDGHVLSDSDLEQPVPGVGLVAGVSEMSHGLGRTVEVDGAIYRFAKTGLAFAPGARATLRVTAAEGRALIGWGAGPSAALSYDGCDSAGRDWVPFAGGLYVTEPTCVDLLVENLGGDRAVVGIAIGVEAAGCR